MEGALIRLREYARVLDVRLDPVVAEYVTKPTPR